MLPVVTPFLAGVIVSPFAKRIVKPIARGVVKSSVGLALDVKQAALSAREEVYDAAAEATGRKDLPEITASGGTEEAMPSKTPHGAAKTR